MVRDDFWGAYCREGMIRAHDRYKLYLPSGSMLPYWNYFEQEEFVPRWGKVVFKYFSSRVMQRILLDMCGVMGGTDQGETAAEFCDYFCAINRLSAEQAYRVLVRQYYDAVRPGGWLVLEIGYAQAEAVLELGKAAGWQAGTCRKDAGGNDRVVFFRKPLENPV